LYCSFALFQVISSKKAVKSSNDGVKSPHAVMNSNKKVVESSNDGVKSPHAVMILSEKVPKSSNDLVKSPEKTPIPSKNVVLFHTTRVSYQLRDSDN